MQLSIRDAARMLQVSEKTIYRWIRKGEIPAYRFHDQYRFNEVELEEWAARHRRPLHRTAGPEGPSPGPPPSLADAIRRGGIHYRVEGRTRDQVFESIVALPGVPPQIGTKALLEMLRTRERIAATAFGGGIALPHPRHPLALGVEEPTVLLCFLEHEVDFGALDGKPVHTVFLILSPTVQAHLQTLARVGFVLQDPAFRKLLERKATREAILSRLDALRAREGAPSRGRGAA
jgi:PTS system nitrogen regulatory IIA component